MPITFPETKKIKSFSLAESHRELVIIFCVLLAIFAGFIFPAKLAGEWFWSNILLFFAFPALIVSFLLKEKIKDFGLSKGLPKIGLVLSLITIAIFIALIYYLLFISGFKKQINFYPAAVDNFWNFLWFNFFAAGLVFFAREFFFRGFLQIGLEKKLGVSVIPLQSILYALLYLKSSWTEIILIFLLSLAAGFIVYKSRSIYYSFLAMWIISLSADIMIIRILHHV